MKPEWILIADAASARLFRRESDVAPLVPIDTVKHDASRSKPSDLGDDRLGHGSADRSSAGVAFQPRTDPKRKEQNRFAAELARRLEQGLERRECARISLYAPARFLGELKAALSPAALDATRIALDIDLMAYGLDELERRIGRALAAHAAQAAKPAASD